MRSADLDPGETEDPYLRCLIWIASELTVIRQEMQRANAGADPADDVETFECRCGHVVTGQEMARRHAVEDHGAPADHWVEMYPDEAVST